MTTGFFAAMAGVSALLIVLAIVLLYKDAVIEAMRRYGVAREDYDPMSSVIIALAGEAEEEIETPEEDGSDVSLGISSEAHDFLGLTKAQYGRGILKLAALCGGVFALMLLLIGASVLVAMMLATMIFAMIWTMVPLLEKDRINQRMAEQVRQFPFFLDIFLLMHQSNGDIHNAIESYQDIFGSNELSQELTVLNEDLKSHSMEDSFDRLRHRVGSEELRDILGDLTQKLRTGADLGSALEQQAEDMRYLRKQLGAAAAERLNAKFNIPVVLAALATLLIFLSPAVAMMTESGFL